MHKNNIIRLNLYCKLYPLSINILRYVTKIILHMILSIGTAWFQKHGRRVLTNEDRLTPRIPTGADVSFFSTLGCSLRAALTSGSMALALLSPFIWSERALAPVPVCRWPSFHLASSLPPWAPLTAGCHNQQQRDDKSLGSTNACTPSTNTHTHRCDRGLRCIWMLTPHTPPFFFSLTHNPPPLFLYPLLSIHPSVSPALTLCLGFSASFSGLWSQEGADHLVGGEPAVG